LAARGTPRGADDVLRAAQRSGPRVVDYSAVDHDDGNLEILDDIPYVSAEPARRRGRFSTLIAATGVAALVGIGMLAVTAMFGSGGAGSPEAAVQQLADAVSHRDPLAAVDVLAPSEVRSMHDSVQHISDRAADLKIVDSASKPLVGVDLSVENLQLASTPLADGYTKVTITGGTISAAAHRAALSQLLQQAMRSSDNPDPSGKVDLARLAASQHLPTFVMTVRHDGRWYVSPAYTALEYLREANDGPAADFGSADASKLGSDSPDHAVQDALRALQAGDWDRLMALSPPDELPVYDYRAWIDQAAADVHPDFSIDSLTTTSDVSGDNGVVKLEASGTYPSNGNRVKWQVGGSCPSLDTYFGFSDGYDGTSASTPNPGFCVAGEGAAVLPIGLLTYPPVPDSAASGAVSIKVVREDGRWFVSPVGTALDVIDRFVQNVDERTIYPIIGLGYLLPPTGTVTINQPLPLGDPVRSGQVYAFDGKAGQQVIGEAATSGRRYSYVDAQLFTADGQDLGYMGFLSRAEGCCGNVLTLPKTGSYRLVLSYVPANTTLTLWDKDRAPKSLVDDKPVGVGSGSGQQCTYTANSVSCYGNAELPLSPSKLPSQPGSGPSPTVSVATTTVP
jgi:hypothetical protein